MRLKELLSSNWKIYAVQTDRGDCLLLDFFNGLDDSFAANIAAMVSLLEEVSERPETPGQWLPDKKCHSITNDKKIWQFTVGRLRVAWFYDDGRVIVCSHGFLKDTQTTKKTDQKQAQQARKDYLKAKSNMSLHIERDQQ